MKNRDVLPGLVASIIAAAVLCTLLVEGGWFVWIPVLLAFWTLHYIRQRFDL